MILICMPNALGTVCITFQLIETKNTSCNTHFFLNTDVLNFIKDMQLISSPENVKETAYTTHALPDVKAWVFYPRILFIYHNVIRCMNLYLIKSVHSILL